MKRIVIIIALVIIGSLFALGFISFMLIGSRDVVGESTAISRTNQGLSTKYRL